MKSIIPTFLLCLPLTAAEPANPQIDYEGFLLTATEARSMREARRVSEEEFLKMAAEPGTVVLDTRSHEKFERLHVRGAVHLNFSDITEESLRRLIPDKDTTVLIYCNNNFEGEPEIFPFKIAAAALNIPTFVTLHAYGYRNVHELGPLLDLESTRIPFAGTAAGAE